MAIKDLIARGIGFSPGSIKYIVTLGLDIGAAVIAETMTFTVYIDQVVPITSHIDQVRAKTVYVDQVFTATV